MLAINSFSDFFYNVDHFSSLSRICYNIAPPLCFGFLVPRHVRSQLPNQGSNPQPPALRGEVLTTGLPAKSQPIPFSREIFGKLPICEPGIAHSFVEQSGEPGIQAGRIISTPRIVSIPVSAQRGELGTQGASREQLERQGGLLSDSSSFTDGQLSKSERKPRHDPTFRKTAVGNSTVTSPSYSRNEDRTKELK